MHVKTIMVSPMAVLPLAAMKTPAIRTSPQSRL